MCYTKGPWRHRNLLKSVTARQYLYYSIRARTLNVKQQHDLTQRAPRTGSKALPPKPEPQAVLFKGNSPPDEPWKCWENSATPLILLLLLLLLNCIINASRAQWTDGLCCTLNTSTGAEADATHSTQLNSTQVIHVRRHAPTAVHQSRLTSRQDEARHTAEYKYYKVFTVHLFKRIRRPTCNV